MAVTAGPFVPLAAQQAALRKPRTLWSDAWRKFRRHRLAMIATLTLTLLILFVLAGPFAYTVSRDKTNIALGNSAPSIVHPLGTNDLGQDLLARVLFGGRISLSVGIVAMLIAISVGIFVGAVAGFFGGQIDNILMRIADLFLSLPQLPVLLITIYLFRDSLRTAFGPELGIFLMIVTVIGALAWMPIARIVRASFLSLKEKEFVEAAHATGVKSPRIIIRHILPNVLSPVIVAATIEVGNSIISESALSFLGLGFPPDVPSWGRLLYDAQNFLELAPYMAIFPGLAIFLTVLSINYLGDGLRDALDPRGLLK